MSKLTRFVIGCALIAAGARTYVDFDQVVRFIQSNTKALSSALGTADGPDGRYLEIMSQITSVCIKGESWLQRSPLGSGSTEQPSDG